MEKQLKGNRPARSRWTNQGQRGLTGWQIVPLVLCVGLHAHADPLSQVTVRWEAPDDCPDRVALDNELHRDLEGSQAPSMRLSVRARVEQLRPETWRVSIVTESIEGKSERAITAHSCQALLDATSLIVAMLIDPETAATHARPIEGSTESAAVAAPPAAVLPPVPSPRNQFPSEIQNQNQTMVLKGIVVPARGAPRPKASGIIAAWAALDYGSLPSGTEVLGGALGLTYGPWRAETLLGAWLPQSKVVGGTLYPQDGGQFDKLAGSAKLCRTAWSPARFALSTCAGFELARLSGTGQHLQGTQTRHSLVPSPQAALLGIFGLTNVLAFRLDLDVSFPLNRPKFGFYSPGQQENEIFQPQWYSLRAAAGFEVHFR
jgi:hypothetical protein